MKQYLSGWGYPYRERISLLLYLADARACALVTWCSHESHDTWTSKGLSPFVCLCIQRVGKVKRLLSDQSETGPCRKWCVEFIAFI